MACLDFFFFGFTGQQKREQFQPGYHILPSCHGNDANLSGRGWAWAKKTAAHNWAFIAPLPFQKGFLHNVPLPPPLSSTKETRTGLGHRKGPWTFLTP